MSKTQLVERYIYAVTRRIPEDQREDVADELRGTIEDMLEEKGKHTGKHITEVLTDLGDPDALAARYKGWKQYLIGPELFPSYVRAIKLAAAIGLPVALGLNLLTQAVVDTPNVGAMIGTTIGILITVAAHIGFWVTLVFFIIERSYKAKKELQDAITWTPDSLPELPNKNQIPVSESVGDLISYALLAILPFVAQAFFGAHNDADFTPFFNPAIWAWTPAFIVLGLLGVIKAGIKIHKRTWTPALAAFNTLLNMALAAGLLLLFTTMAIVNPAIVELIKSNTPNTENLAQIVDWTVLISVVITVGIYLYDSIASIVKAVRLTRQP